MTFCWPQRNELCLCLSKGLWVKVLCCKVAKRFIKNSFFYASLVHGLKRPNLNVVGICKSVRKIGRSLISSPVGFHYLLLVSPMSHVDHNVPYIHIYFVWICPSVSQSASVALRLSDSITYISVSIPNQWAVAGPFWQLARISYWSIVNASGLNFSSQKSIIFSKIVINKFYCNHGKYWLLWFIGRPAVAFGNILLYRDIMWFIT